MFRSECSFDDCGIAESISTSGKLKNTSYRVCRVIFRNLSVVSFILSNAYVTADELMQKVFSRSTVPNDSSLSTQVP